MIKKQLTVISVFRSKAKLRYGLPMNVMRRNGDAIKRYCR